MRLRSDTGITVLFILVLMSLLTITGCGSAPLRVDADNDPDALTSYGIDYEDWKVKAAVLTKSLLGSPALDGFDNSSPAVLMIDRFRNKTGEQLDMQRLTDTIRIALNQTGKAQTSYRYSLGGRSEAVGAQGIDEEKEFFADDKTDAPKAKAPDFTLSGVVTKDYIRSGRDRQTTYVIKLSLARTGGAGVFVWEDQEPVRKRGTKPAIGF